MKVFAKNAVMTLPDAVIKKGQRLMYKELTEILEKMPQAEYGHWFADRENDGSPEHPIQMPFVQYSKFVNDFSDAVFSFMDSHPEYELTRYRDIMERYGIEWSRDSMNAVEVSDLDGGCVMALLIGAIRAEKFCDGALLNFFEEGSIQQWLKRLKGIDDSLPVIAGKKIFDTTRTSLILAKPEILEGIRKYSFIMDRVQNTNVAEDTEFQKSYDDFYTLYRYPKEFRLEYYSYMEKNKTRKPSFEEVLAHFGRFGNLEASFSSKLVHTLDPKQPIWDKNVAVLHFGYRIPYNGMKNREQTMVRRYEDYRRDFLAYAATDAGKTIVDAFDSKFPSNSFTDTKKVDFVLWQDVGKWKKRLV